MFESDEAIRSLALNDQESFIIQAPAGSGKTELLIQRYLSLLAKVTQGPEEIIAITFTRKAAAEMRERILSAINMAKEKQPLAPHQRLTWQLAQQVLQQNETKGWAIEKNSHRLRILTIDALAAMLCHQSPVLSGLDSTADIADLPNSLYREAILNCLNHSSGKPWENAVQHLLLHLDNRSEQFIQLLINLLSKREQWLPYLVQQSHQKNSMRERLEHTLKEISKEKIIQADSLFSPRMKSELLPLMQYAGQQIKNENNTHPLAILSQLMTFPHSEKLKINHCNTLSTDFKTWKAIAKLLLTQEGKLKKTIDKRSGFPAASAFNNKEEKKRAKAFKTNMSNWLNQQSDNLSLIQSLQDIFFCPPIGYEEPQWKTLAALIDLLPLLVAELSLTFKENHAIDFTELSLSALKALGTEEAPTDLALHLDYRIKHLLLDEFQDTSILHFSIIERLIAEWQPQDGHTLFIVGDPMQSIYRFRDANVGLFLRIQDQGIAQLKPKSLILKNNFRSIASIVNWHNALFEHLFPQSKDIITGAIPFSKAIASLPGASPNHPSLTSSPDTAHPAIYYTPLINTNAEDEAKSVVQTIKTIQDKKPLDTIAILVRSRQQLNEILPYLEKSHIEFEAIDIKPLNQSPVIEDLMTLTTALLHFGHRLAWFSLLRAPWCGLSLKDLLTLANYRPKRSLWENMQSDEAIGMLSCQGQVRLKKITHLLTSQLSYYGRMPLSTWIKQTWLLLGGPACYSDPMIIDHSECFFKLLHRIQPEYNLELLHEKVAYLFFNRKQKKERRLSVMTIHKAKGLEFDHVIMPRCHQIPRANTSDLMMWLEKPSASNGTDLVLAPLPASNQTTDPIHSYLKSLDRISEQYESQRLFYVATTRAKQSIHFFFSLKQTPSHLINPPPVNSFARYLFDFNQKILINNTIDASADPEKQHKLTPTPTLYRLSDHWNNPISAQLNPQLEASTNSPKTFQLLLEDHYKRYIGITLHEILAMIGNQKTNHLHLIQPITYTDYAKHRLLQLGIGKKQHLTSCNRIIHILEQVLADPRGRWILKPHTEANSEYTLYYYTNQTLSHITLDRTFIDESGIRWIIDFKTTPSKINKNEIIDGDKIKKEYYKQQLNHYGLILSQIEKKPIWLGLYFTATGEWIAWPLTIRKKSDRTTSSHLTLSS